ncbi:MAG: multicopper oxidase domain-containing protein [Gemmatimonadaceae bacterium]
MLCRALAIVALTALSSAQAQNPALFASASLERATFEDYRAPAGRLENGVLHVTLEVKAAAWRPWEEDGPALRTHVYAADGSAPRTPGPLIRVRAGTPVQVTLRNSLDDLLVLRGLTDRGKYPASAAPFAAIGADSVVVAPGGDTQFRFTPTEPGTWVYIARTYNPAQPPPPAAGPLPVRAADRSLWGVLIVDERDAPVRADERIFLITHWGDPTLPGSFLPATRFFVNGASWPHTERLTYQQGDTVRWRVINTTGRPHPMHLHGVYFSLDARGNQLRERVIAPAERRLAVTEVLDVAESMRLSWVAQEPGNWLFHCHFMRHMSWLQTSAPNAPPDRHAEHDAAGEDLLGGLVLGIHVRPNPAYRLSDAATRRRLDLHITRRDGVFGGSGAGGAGAGFSFVLASDGRAPAADSIQFPGSLIMLRRGEPSEIMVHNRSDVPLGVHWHGLELESWADGVPGWSGLPGGGRPVPAVAARDSFRVRMTPPRAGTFMYHVHSEPGHELAQGLYGPLLVLEPGQAWDPERGGDRVFLLGSLGVGDDPPAAINGETEPSPIALRAGETYRLRFMHISPDDDKRVTLLGADGGVQPWRAVAKDGADLPPSQARETPARLRINVGETYDFAWTPAPGEYTLRVLTAFDQGAPAFRRRAAPAPHTAEVRIIVR